MYIKVPFCLMCASNRNVNGILSVINDYISWDINNQINIIGLDIVERVNVKYFLTHQF